MNIAGHLVVVSLLAYLSVTPAHESQASSVPDDVADGLQTVEIGNGDVRVTLATDGRSLGWREFFDVKRGVDLIDGASVLFRVDALERTDAGETTRFFWNHSAWDAVEIEARGAEAARVTLRQDGILQVALDLATVGPELRLNGAVELLSPSLTLRSMHLPYVELAQLGDGTPGGGDGQRLLIPERSGKVLDYDMQAPVALHHARTYPSGGMPLPFGAFYDGTSGVYFGVHDTSGGKKQLTLATMVYPAHRRLLVDFSWPAAVGARQLKLAGTQVLRIFRGDWYDAAQIYRDWAKAETPERFRRRIPKALNDAGFWIADHCTVANQCERRLKAFQAKLGLPLMLHWYNWHKIAFDSEYPHYFPAIDGFASLIPALQAAGVRLMPYINGLQWDRSLADFPREDAVMTPAGDLISFPDTTLTSICPTREHFHATLRDVSARLFQEHHVDGLYVDQMAALDPLDCRNPAHHHTQGDGSWWNRQGYWKLLDVLEATRRQDEFMTSEWVNEEFVGRVDGLLTNNFSYQGQVPLFNTVYNDAVRTFGRFHWRGPDVVKAYRMKIGQSLVYGNQLGWIDAGLLDVPEIASLSLGLAKLRQRFQGYFDGPLRRAPAMVTALPDIVADWNFYWRQTMIALPPALSGRFQRADGQEVTVVVNIAEEPLTLACGMPVGARYWTNAGEEIVERQVSDAPLRLAAGQALVTSADVTLCHVGR